MKATKMCGIYSITNLSNGKRYIGQSIDISKRWVEHKRQLKLGVHINKYLQSAVNKYGLDNFSFSIVEETERNLLDDRERFWINALNTFAPNGYNLTLGGSGNLGWAIPEGTKEKSMIKVIRLDTMEVYNSINDTSKCTGVHSTAVSMCCRGRCSYARDKDGEIAVFAYMDEYESTKDKSLFVQERLDKAKYNENYCFAHSKAIVRLNDGKIYMAVKDAAKDIGIKNPTSIIEVAKGKQRSSGEAKNGEKFSWRYIDDYNNMTAEDISNAIAYANSWDATQNGENHQVICLNTMEIFSGVNQAAKLMGICQSSISSCCAGKQKIVGKDCNTNLGYVFMYYDGFVKSDLFNDEKKRASYIQKKNTRKKGKTSDRAVICVNTGEVFKTAKLAASTCGIKYPTQITQVCRGNGLTAGKDQNTGEPLKWRYATPSDYITA